jgi:hypothetical protein
VFRGLGDMGADIAANTSDGRRLVVRCRHTLAGPAGPDIERFAGTARHLHRADIALYVTTSIPGIPCRTTAQRRRVTLIDRNVPHRAGIWPWYTGRSAGTPAGSALGCPDPAGRSEPQRTLV